MPRKRVTDFSSFTRLFCPKKHPLPNTTKYGQCTPLHCPLDLPVDEFPHEPAIKLPSNILPVAAEAAETIAVIAEETHIDEALATTAKRKQLQDLSHAAGRSAARKAFFKVPTNMDAPTAEAWAQAKAVSLLPDALAELEYQLKLGDDTMRRDAARDILDINGMRKRDSPGNGGATIILNLGGKELPWAQKVVDKLTNGANPDKDKDGNVKPKDEVI